MQFDFLQVTIEPYRAEETKALKIKVQIVVSDDFDSFFERMILEAKKQINIVIQQQYNKVEVDNPDD